MRRPNYTEEDHKRRAEQFWELVQKHRNLSLSLLEPWVNPYRDISSARLKEIEQCIKQSLLDAFSEGGMRVLISADLKTRNNISYNFAEKLKSRGNIVRLCIRDKRWFVDNWWLFADELEMDSIRNVFVFFKLDLGILAKLSTHWWDPGPLVSLGSVMSRSLRKEVESCVLPGTFVFSVSFNRLSSCEIFFHPDDLVAVALCVYNASQKTDWGVLRLGDGPPKVCSVVQKSRHEEAEGGVYLCDWEKTAKGYTLHVRGLPTVTTTDECFEEAAIKICEMICMETGDGEAVLDYSPLPPTAPAMKEYLNPGLVCIMANESVSLPKNPPGLFSDGYCPVCGKGMGARTDAALEVEEFPEDTDGVFCPAVSHTGPVFSHAFIKVLTDEEKAIFRLIQVTSKEPDRRKFFELVGNPVAQFVGLAGYPGYNAKPCAQCDYVQEHHLFDSEMHKFVVAEDLPNPLPSVFPVGHGGHVLCMTAERWQSIRGKPGTKKLLASRLYVIPRCKAMESTPLQRAD